MPSILHDNFTRNVEHEIKSQLDNLAGRSDLLRAFAEKITLDGSGRIEFGSPEVIAENPESAQTSHEPDASFGYIDAVYPPVVVEISYSQKRKDLAKLADSYILDSDSNIRLVVGLDIEYLGTKKATISMWRPRLVTDDGANNKVLVVEQVQDEVRSYILLVIWM